MKLYQINYQLRKHRKYDLLFERIKSYGIYFRPLDDCWIIASHKSALEIRNELAKATHVDDALLVTRLQGEGAWFNLGSQATSWLKEQLGKATT